MSAGQAIHKALVAVMADVGVVPKEGWNAHGKYEFRRAEDVMNALHPALVKHGVLLIPETLDLTMSSYKSAGNKNMQHAVVKVSHEFIASADGSSVKIITCGEGSDLGDKAVNKAHTAALKTALCEGLCIPTEDFMVDSERSNPEERREEPEPAEGPATDADLDKLRDALEARCEDLKLDPDTYAPIIVADVLDDTPWDWDSVPDIPRKEIGWICSSISIWEERDTAPGFNQDAEPPAAEEPS